jgi:hypothetical protein
LCLAWAVEAVEARGRAGARRDEETMAAAAVVQRWARRHGRRRAAVELPAAWGGEVSAEEGMAAGAGRNKRSGGHRVL